MNEINFNSPTILKGTQYGKTITIELDHSDTSIDEVMDGFLTILNGLGYLPTTINDYFKDKVKDIWEDEHQIVKDALCTDEEFSKWDNEKVDWPWLNEDTNIDAEEAERRMDIIGQNGNEGTHYDKNEDNDVNVWGDEDELETPTDEYKGIYSSRPTYDWDGETNDILLNINDSITLIKDRMEDIDMRMDNIDEQLDILNADVANIELDIAFPPPNEHILKAKDLYDRTVKVHERDKEWRKDVVDMETGEVSVDGGFDGKKLNKQKMVRGKIKDLKG